MEFELADAQRVELTATVGSDWTISLISPLWDEKTVTSSEVIEADGPDGSPIAFASAKDGHILDNMVLADILEAELTSIRVTDGVRPETLPNLSALSTSFATDVVPAKPPLWRQEGAEQDS